MIGTILTLAGMGLSALGQAQAGKNAKKAAYANATTIEETSRANSELIMEGSELNAEVQLYNARSAEGAATDAIARGKEKEEMFRRQIKGLIGTQRTQYAASGVDVSFGSALDVQMDTARQGELDALRIRTDAAREAWGYQVEAKGYRIQAGNIRKLGRLQAKNVRDVGRSEAYNARMGGNYASSAAKWGVASTLVTGAGNIYMQRKYGVS